MATIDCLSDDLVQRFVQGRVGAELAARVDEHIARCALCRRVVADTARYFFDEAPEALARVTVSAPAAHTADATAGPPAVLPVLAPGTTVGRYVIEDLVGAGGAGVVYRAHDPQLARRVAVKLVVPRPGAAGADLVREAQAMARISHPNVVAVHDAGVLAQGVPGVPGTAGVVFLVMELVEGSSLALWLRARPRPWQEIVAAFLQAGRGLEAAHAADLVHGDVKPENVLVGSDGRPRVTDFGLATAGPPGGRAAPADRAGALSGTPLYMAPEQFRGAEADQAADQFSFCLALYRALYGQHPFAPDQALGDTKALAAAAAAGTLRPPTGGTTAPAWLQPILGRGLARRPEDRYPSMTELLAHLQRGLERTRGARRRSALAAGAGAALATVALAWALVPGREARLAAPPVCGNARVETGEECDDGNRVETDGCLPGCRFAGCGDGKLRTGVEECDDGNRADGDGCSRVCLRCDQGTRQAVSRDSGHCFTRHETPRPWVEAAAACREIGGHLMTFSNHEETGEVTAALVVGDAASYWIGFGAPAGPAPHFWMTGEPLAPIVVDWTAQAPVTQGTCAAHGSAAPWSVHPCEKPLGFLCEQDGWVLDPRTNRAYRAIYRELTWQGAAEACARIGAHLATIVDGDERAFLSGRFFGTYWVGGIKQEADGGFGWITGEPFAAELFGQDDPNLIRVPACVVFADDRSLRDRVCDGSESGPYGVLCEID